MHSETCSRSPLTSRPKAEGQRGEDFLEGVFVTCETLASHPTMGELRTEFKTALDRSFSAGRYVIYFQPTAAGIVVARMLHGSRDHSSIL